MYGYGTQPLNWKGWMSVLVCVAEVMPFTVPLTILPAWSEPERGRRRCDLAGADGRCDFDLRPALLGESGRVGVLALGPERITGLV